MQPLRRRASASVGMLAAPRIARERLVERGRGRFLGEREVDLGRLEIDARDGVARASRKLEDAARPLADQRVPGRFEMEVIATELGHVHEAVDREVVERDEDAEARYAADRPGECIADLVLHEVALEP